MAFKYGYLRDFTVWNEFSAFFARQDEIFLLGQDLSRNHADDRECPAARINLQLLRINLSQMHRVKQLRRAWSRFQLQPVIDEFSVIEYHLGIKILQGVPHDQIRIKSGRHRTCTAEAIAAGRLYGRHLNGRNRADAHADRFADIVVDISLTNDVLDMTVVRTEAKTLRIRIVLHNTFDDHFQVFRSASLADVADHAHGPLPHDVLICRTLMIGRDAGQHIGSQVLRCQVRRMAVLDLAVKELQLGIHGWIAVNYGFIIHHFPEAQHTTVVQVLFHIPGRQPVTVIIHFRRRDAGCNHGIDMRGRILCLVKQVINSVTSRDIGRFMGIHYKCGGSALCSLRNQHLRIDHRRLQMQVRINKAACQILTFQVNLFLALIIAYTDDHAVLDSNISFFHTVRKDIHNLRIFQHQIRLNQLSGSLGTSHIFLQLHVTVLLILQVYHDPTTQASTCNRILRMPDCLRHSSQSLRHCEQPLRVFPGDADHLFGGNPAKAGDLFRDIPKAGGIIAFSLERFRGQIGAVRLEHQIFQRYFRDYLAEFFRVGIRDNAADADEETEPGINTGLFQGIGIGVDDSLCSHMAARPGSLFVPPYPFFAGNGAVFLRSKRPLRFRPGDFGGRPATSVHILNDPQRVLRGGTGMDDNRFPAFEGETDLLPEAGDLQVMGFHIPVIVKSDFTDRHDLRIRQQFPQPPVYQVRKASDRFFFGDSVFLAGKDCTRQSLF